MAGRISSRPLRRYTPVQRCADASRPPPSTAPARSTRPCPPGIRATVPGCAGENTLPCGASIPARSRDRFARRGPRRSVPAGPRLPSIDASAVAMRSSAAARPSGVFRLTTIARLPSRSGSSPPPKVSAKPAPGRTSTVMSAPMPARMRAAMGPGPMPSDSRTCTPCTGCCNDKAKPYANSLRAIRSFITSLAPP